MDPARVDEIAKAIVAEYDKEFSGSKIDEYDRAIKQYEHELDKLVDALVDAPKVAHKRIYDKMESLEAQKASMEVELAKLRIASEIRLTEPEVRAWLKTFCNGDLFNADFRQNIIDTFVNCVYLYDDKLAVFYNLKGGKEVSYPDLNNVLEPDLEENGSDLDALTPLKTIKSEPAYVFVNGMFGCIFRRDDTD